MTSKQKNPAEWLAEIWSRIQSAPHRRNDPWRTPTMATVSPSGVPESRTVVLRRAFGGRRELEIHTDEASGKHGSLSTNPLAEFCFWHPKRRVQVRMLGHSRLVTLSQSEAEWANLAESAQSIYRVSPPPGEKIEEPSAFEYTDEPRFCRVITAVVRIDALHLARPKHRRMIARWQCEGWQSEWVVP